MAEHFCKSLKIEEAKVDLPVEILIEIVLRLPIKSILTWTSVSKSWNSLIKNPNFISTHLNNHNQKPQLLFLRKLGKSIRDYTSKVDKEVYSLNWDNEAFDEYTRFDFPFRALRLSDIFHIVGTSNGLVCLANAKNFFVWNPCIRKYVTIPTFFWGYAGCGFGFDSKTNDYKVVKIVGQQNYREVKVKDSKTNEYKVLRIADGQKEGEFKVNVYSLATGEWKMVSDVPRRCILSEGEPRQAFVNGALHWAASYKTNDVRHDFILAFDLGDENFHEIMLPKDLLIRNSLSRLRVSVFGESLAVYSTPIGDTCTEKWVMKEYGALESWTKVLTVDSQGVGFRIPPKVVGFRRSGEVVMEIEWEQGKLVSVDPEHKKIKDISLRVPYGYTFVDPFVESLVLLNNSTVSYKGKRRTGGTRPKLVYQL